MQRGVACGANRTVGEGSAVGRRALVEIEIEEQPGSHLRRHRGAAPKRGDEHGSPCMTHRGEGTNLHILPTLRTVRGQEKDNQPVSGVPMACPIQESHPSFSRARRS